MFFLFVFYLFPVVLVVLVLGRVFSVLFVVQEKVLFVFRLAFPLVLFKNDIGIFVRSVNCLSQRHALTENHHKREQ